MYLWFAIHGQCVVVIPRIADQASPKVPTLWNMSQTSASLPTILIEVFACIHSGVASLLELGGKGLSLQAFSPLRAAAAT